MSWLWNTGLVVVGLYVALRVVLGVLIVITHLVEKRPICSLTPIDLGGAGRTGDGTDLAEGTPNPYKAPETPISAYAKSRAGAADALGFSRFGPFGQSKGGIYQSLSFFWESPTGDILAIVAWGTIAAIPVDKTILYTTLEDGGYLVTSDKPTGQIAPWIFDDEIALGFDFERLVDHHRRRLRGSGRSWVPFENRDGLADYRELRSRLIQSFVDRGESYYLDEGHSTVRSNVKGAFLGLIRTFRPPKVVRA